MRKQRYPIKHWSYSSLITFLRNPLAWHKRYVEGVYDMPVTPSSVIGRAGHVALQHFYSLPARGRTQAGGIGKEAAVALGLEYVRRVPDFEIDFGKAKTSHAKKLKRLQMEKDYQQAISFYLARPPKYKIIGVEVVALADVPGLPLPVKAISDLVVESKLDKNAVDIVDHKFVDSFNQLGAEKPLFILQAIFNYYTVLHEFGRPVKRFILQECKKTKNRDGRSQMRRYVIDFEDCEEEFRVFHRLLADATAEITRKRKYLPNPSDMFEGKNSFDIYLMGLGEE